MSAGLILHRLELCEQGHVVGAELLAARHGGGVALALTIGRDGYNLLQVAKRFIQAAGVDNADEEGE